MTLTYDRGQLLLSHFDVLAKNDLETFLTQLPHPVLLVGPGASLGKLDETTGAIDSLEHETVGLSEAKRNATTLVIPLAKRGPGGGAEILWLGRAVTCDVVLPFETVSKVHAVLSYNRSQELVVADVGSKNGTWMNRKRIEDGCQALLQDQDMLRFGNIDARFLFPESLYLYLQTDAQT